MADGMNTQEIKNRIHTINNRVQWGWTHWLSPYIAMISVVSIIEILMAKLFPSLLFSATALNALLLFSIVYFSYWFGKNHEKFEKEQMHKPRHS